MITGSPEWDTASKTNLRFFGVGDGPPDEDGGTRVVEVTVDVAVDVTLLVAVYVMTVGAVILMVMLFSMKIVGPGKDLVVT